MQRSIMLLNNRNAGHSLVGGTMVVFLSVAVMTSQSSYCVRNVTLRIPLWSTDTCIETWRIHPSIITQHRVPEPRSDTAQDGEVTRTSEARMLPWLLQGSTFQ